MMTYDREIAEKLVAEAQEIRNPMERISWSEVRSLLKAAAREGYELGYGAGYDKGRSGATPARVGW